MKALTLTQPWASLVASGAKTIETRSWSTKYRGLLAIHAAASRPALGPVGPYVVRDLAGERVIHGAGTPLVTRSLPLGAVVATCRLIDVIRTDDVSWTELWAGWAWQGPTGARERSPFAADDPAGGRRLVAHLDQRPLGDFSPGRYVWLLDDIRPASEPVPAKGALGLWEWSA